MEIRQQSAADRENFAGLVERDLILGEDSGFCVLRVKAHGQRDLITVVGHAMTDVQPCRRLAST